MKTSALLTPLLRVTAYVLRAVKLFRRSITYPKGPLTPEELVEAERLWVVDTQTHLRSERNLKVWQKQFDLFTDDDGLTRCRGRLKNADLPYATKYPLFLPRRGHFTTLVVRRAQSRHAQRREGDPDGCQEEVLDNQGTQSCQINYPLLCHLQAIRRSTIQG